MSALCTDYEHYALTMHMHTFHKLCLTADLAVATSGEIRRLILVSTNHQPGLSDMQQQPGLDKCSDNSALQRGKYAGSVGLCWNYDCCWMTGVESSIELFGRFHKVWFASESRASKSG